MEDGRTVEVGAIGIEGITGTNAVFGIQEAIYDTLVQLQGEALCIEYGKLRSHLQLSTALTSLVRGYTHFAISQLAQTVACNRLHSLEQRCANWFIVAQVNARSDTFLITHEFLSMMLGSSAFRYLHRRQGSAK